MNPALLRANTLRLPLRDNSVDLIVTSPPYFEVREYEDQGDSLAGQLGGEPTPGDFLRALWSVTDEMLRVLKPSGSLFVNLGDKYATKRRGPNSTSGVVRQHANRPRSAPTYDVATKSLLGLPWRWALGVALPDPYRTAYDRPEADPLYPDQLLEPATYQRAILRGELLWEKPNPRPESVQDRPWRTHEQWFHVTKARRYYHQLDELRRPYKPGSEARIAQGFKPNGWDEASAPHNGVAADTLRRGGRQYEPNPLGRLPGSVWTVPTEPLYLPPELGVDHFAAYPVEWPRRLITGFSPPAVCLECGAGRRPVVAIDRDARGRNGNGRKAALRFRDDSGFAKERLVRQTTIIGQACDCWASSSGQPAPADRPAVVLDPFCGTGSTMVAARALGRFGVSIDLSADYLRVARWRIFESGHVERTRQRTNEEAQGALEWDTGPLATFGPGLEQLVDVGEVL